MTQQKTLMTADEFFEFCDRNDGRYELVDGEVVELAPAQRRHGRTAVNIGAAFHNYCRRTGAGWAEVEVATPSVPGRTLCVVQMCPWFSEMYRTTRSKAPLSPARRTLPWRSFRHPTPRPNWSARWQSTWPPDRSGCGSRSATRREPRSVVDHHADGATTTYTRR